MKYIYILLFLFVGTLSAQEYYYVSFDTLGNYTSSPKYRDFTIPSGGKIDSITIGVFARGEIDIDSIRVQGGLSVAGTTILQNTNSGRVDAERFNALVTKALTIDLADGVSSYTVDYTSSTLGLTNVVLRNYNKLRIYLATGTTGNDKADVSQHAGVVISVYRQAY